MAAGSIDIGAIIQGGTGISEVISGMLVESKTREALQEHRKTRPLYEIPSSIQEQLEILRQRAGQGLPGEELIASQIQQQAAQGVSGAREAATSAADLLGATTNIFGQQTQALTDLQIASARQQAQNQLGLAQGLGNFAQYQEQAFIFNEAIPYQTRLNELMGVQQSAFDLITGGINTISQSAANFSGSGITPQIESDLSYNNPQGYGVQGIDPALQGIDYQPTYLNQGTYTGPGVGQYQYNPSGGQTLGQYMYNPSGQITLGSF